MPNSSMPVLGVGNRGVGLEMPNTEPCRTQSGADIGAFGNSQQPGYNAVAMSRWRNLAYQFQTEHNFGPEEVRRGQGLASEPEDNTSPSDIARSDRLR